MTRNSCSQIFWTIVLCVVMLMFNKQSCADNPAFWSLSEGTNGEDVFWTSPTAVDVGFPRYGTTLEITRVEAFTFLGGTDVTDQLGETTGTAVSESLPVTLINNTFTDPTSDTSATMVIGIDPNGFGQASITDVTLGTILFINITRIEVDANITVQGVVPGDFDGDLGVDHIDLDLWESSYGVDAGADTDFNGISDGLDFLDWQRFLGSALSLGEVSTILVPEPATQLVAMGLLSLCLSQRYRPPTTIGL